MIETLHIENFRCLRDVNMSLRPLTVFVGANASGTSSAFAALQSTWDERDAWQLALPARSGCGSCTTAKAAKPASGARA